MSNTQSEQVWQELYFDCYHAHEIPELTKPFSLYLNVAI